MNHPLDADPQPRNAEDRITDTGRREGPTMTQPAPPAERFAHDCACVVKYFPESRNGLHACRRALDALIYAPGPVVCRVRLGGEGATVRAGARSPTITRSDGYVFAIMASPRGPLVTAGCRAFTLPEARAHWMATRGGTRVGAETFAILDCLERVFAIYEHSTP